MTGQKKSGRIKTPLRNLTSKLASTIKVPARGNPELATKIASEKEHLIAVPVKHLVFNGWSVRQGDLVYQWGFGCKMWDAESRIAGRVGEYLKESAIVAAIKFAMIPLIVKSGSG
jgi:hypothetical protein